MAEEPRSMRIGVTDNLRPRHFLENYYRWLRRVHPEIEFIKLSYHLKNEDLAETIDGLLLTGGGDVHPALYGMGDAIDRVEEVNELRDAFEFKVIERALDREIPVLGICRGLQVMNVYLGGSLVIDIASAGYGGHTSDNDAGARHPIVVDPHSMLGMIAGQNPHSVNSLHHQAVDRVGRGLKVVAKSEDGLIEAMEWVLKDRMPFLLLVQWHPERMADDDNPCSKHVAEYFVREVSRSLNDTSIPEKETE